MKKTEPKNVNENGIDETVFDGIDTETGIDTEPISETYPNGKPFPSVIGTTELTEIIRLRTGIELTTKRLRIVLRTIISDDGYTKYRFSYPSETVDNVVGIVKDEIETVRNRKSLINDRKSVESKPKIIFSVDRNKSVSTETK